VFLLAAKNLARPEAPESPALGENRQGYPEGARQTAPTLVHRKAESLARPEGESLAPGAVDLPAVQTDSAAEIPPERQEMAPGQAETPAGQAQQEPERQAQAQRGLAVVQVESLLHQTPPDREAMAKNQGHQGLAG